MGNKVIHDVITRTDDVHEVCGAVSYELLCVAEPNIRAVGQARYAYKLLHGRGTSIH